MQLVQNVTYWKDIMGMFDFVKCSSDIGELTNESCQTKSIEKEEGGTMSFYWVDPVGALWYADYSGTSSLEQVEDESLPIWRRYRIKPNGNKGRLYRISLTGDVKIYSSSVYPDGMIEWTVCILTFVEGKLHSYSYK